MENSTGIVLKSALGSFQLNFLGCYFRGTGLVRGDGAVAAGQAKNSRAPLLVNAGGSLLLQEPIRSKDTRPPPAPRSSGGAGRLLRAERSFGRRSMGRRCFRGETFRPELRKQK